jgi:hypothetical protein
LLQIILPLLRIRSSLQHRRLSSQHRNGKSMRMKRPALPRRDIMMQTVPAQPLRIEIWIRRYMLRPQGSSTLLQISSHLYRMTDDLRRRNAKSHLFSFALRRRMDSKLRTSGSSHHFSARAARDRLPARPRKRGLQLSLGWLHHSMLSSRGLKTSRRWRAGILHRSATPLSGATPTSKHMACSSIHSGAGLQRRRVPASSCKTWLRHFRQSSQRLNGRGKGRRLTARPRRLSAARGRGPTPGRTRPRSRDRPTAA